ncbi:hypothetical protein P4B35_10645 [Pontiellaceae bacterium B12227]|nr:hypothetical protein [Pontiellaceae bacterium B12227]
MKHNIHKAGTLIVWVAGTLAFTCLVILLTALSRDRQSAEKRRITPPPVYTESRPTLPVAEMASLPESDFISVDNSKGEIEWAR